MDVEKRMTYRTYLEREYQSRVRRNLAYSMRAFARDLDIQSSKLSEILNAKCGISASLAASVAQKLKLTEVETQHFITLVEVEHSRSAVGKRQAEELLKKFDQVHGYNELDIERFKIISDWYHNAILELTEVDDFQSNIHWIAKRLNITTKHTEDAIQRLIDFGLLINKEGRYVQTQMHLATPSGIPSREIREFHHQILKKAIYSIDENTVHERDLSSMTMAISEDQIPYAKEKIKEFRRKLAQELQEKTPKQRVYNLAIQFFPMDQKDSSNE